MHIMYTSMYIALKELSETPHTQGILKGYLECLVVGVSGGGGVELTLGASGVVVGRCLLTSH